MNPDIQNFINGCKSGSAESKLAGAYNQALANFESIQSDLVKCLRVEKTTKGLHPIFAAEAEGFSVKLTEAEHHLDEVQKDIEAYLALTDGEVSLDSLTEKLIRYRRTISNVTFEANAIRERTVRQNKSMSPQEAEQLEPVQQAFDKRDRIKAELEPMVSDLQSKLSKAKKTLEKYN